MMGLTSILLVFKGRTDNIYVWFVRMLMDDTLYHPLVLPLLKNLSCPSCQVPRILLCHSHQQPYPSRVFVYLLHTVIHDFNTLRAD